MYTPISCEFFDQLNVAMQRKIPSTIVYLKNDEKITAKGLIKTMSVIDGIEYLVLNTNEQIKLDTEKLVERFLNQTKQNLFEYLMDYKFPKDFLPDFF